MSKVMKRRSYAAVGLSLAICSIIAGLLYGLNKPILKAMDEELTTLNSRLDTALRGDAELDAQIEHDIMSGKLR
jgi:hypothetical protein